jgi:hypothetical protein
MRNTNKSLIAIAFVALLSSCVTPVLKSVAYKKLYSEAPKTILIMPPINKSTNVEAKEYFHSTLSVPLANQGYYVIPPFLSMEILKKESAYNSELSVGSEVRRGLEIGYVGSTGRSTGPHLHFELRKNNVYLNPLSNGLELDLWTLSPLDQHELTNNMVLFSTINN